MSRELLKHEGITNFTGAYQDYLRKDSPKPFWLVNTNKLVRFYSGADGLKTGYTSEAKFCLSATAKRDNLRVVAVVLGEPNTKTRNAEVTKLFDYAFAQYTNYSLFKTGDSLGEFRINKGQVSTVPLVAKQNYSILMKKGTDTANIRHELQLDPNLRAPIGVGQPIGKIMVYNGDNVLAEYPLESPQAVDKASWWKLFKRTTSQLFTTD
ncbi:D-alanyl-D-alanine carboxypeptidase DacF precursor [compost metagenome]